MALPVVAIVGRPNVGKSSLLNCLVRRMASIVEPTAGVTRDRVGVVHEQDGVYFELVDTGGWGIVDRGDLSEHIERQIQYAIEEAAMILFVVDVQTGVAPLDVEVANMLRKYEDRVVLLANKVDEMVHEPEAADFARLGYGTPMPVSAMHSRNRTELLEMIVERMRDAGGEDPGEAAMKVAVIGRQNTGKSTFINALAGEEHVIVSEIAGTTRDAIDLRFEQGGREFIAIDTAGVRKRSRTGDEPIEYYGYRRVLSTIRRADVVVLFIDSTSSITTVDKRLAGLAAEEMKPCVLVINKWDLAHDKAESAQYEDYLTKMLPEVDYAPMVFASAKDAHNTDAVIDTAWSLFKQARMRVSTGRLNQALEEALAGRGPSIKRGTRPPKLYFATQVGIAPPTIVCFVNHPDRVTREYQRYLINRLQTRLPFEEVPIRLVFRARRSGDGRGGKKVN